MYIRTLFLNAAHVDEHFENEVELLENRPILHSEYEDRLRLRGENIVGTTIIYRGWILTPDAYRRVNELVEKAGAKMLVSPEAYENSQFAEGWLNIFSNFTPETTVFPYSTPADVIAESFVNSKSSYVVKGSSKSLKHDWDNAMFAKNGDDVNRVVANFKEQVSENEELTILVREFENWVPGELRVWWMNEKFVIDQHPNNVAPVDFGPEFELFLNSAITPHVNQLGSTFVTTDFVRDENNEFRLVEVGNGQVSGANDFNKVLELFNN